MQLLQSSGGVNLNDLLKQVFKNLFKVGRGALQALQLNLFGVRNFALVHRPLNGSLKRAEGLFSRLQDLSLVDLECGRRNLVRTFWSITISFVWLLLNKSVIFVNAFSVKEEHELVLSLIKPSLDLQPPFWND